MSLSDRIIDRGRIWADYAHRFTTYALLGVTGISTVVAVYGLTSLVAHNRRQKRAWIERELQRLQDAQTAFLKGEATAEQLHLLEQERAGEELATKRKQEDDATKTRGLWAQVKGLVGKGAAAGEMGADTVGEAEAREVRQGGRERLLEEGWLEGEAKPMPQQREGVKTVPVAVEASNIKGVGLDEKGRPVPIGRTKEVVDTFEAHRRTGEQEVTARTGITGGSLDVLAGNVASAVDPSKGSGDWLSWIRGNKS